MEGERDGRKEGGRDAGDREGKGGHGTRFTKDRNNMRD